MMKLAEFATLEDAKLYQAPRERMISHDMVVTFLTKHDCVTTLQSSTDEKAKGFYLAVLSGVEEFNLMNSHPVGLLQQGLLSLLVSVGAVNQAFADECINYSNTTYLPYENATLYDFLKATGTCPVKKVPVSKGWLQVTTTAVTEPHRPQVYVEFETVKQRVAGFDVISAAGTYVAQVPRDYATLLVDDPYGVIQ
ncbi:hypothetical protein IT774_05200 [Salinimonas marina]|uniref:Uncharacterized protein n=1 Tax=Salinimonas marina TaxID=2785918 RepID=A0A7S9HEE0_9ALTE|nr:hypothetical protein [Salinimonas marina]QPG06571.1 hypothetical protein IT774_05200 [Salinimonas marina]